MAGFKNSNLAGSGASVRFGKIIFRSQNNTPDETNSINIAVSCYKEAVQFSAYSMSLLVFDKICGMAMNFEFFNPCNTN